VAELSRWPVKSMGGEPLRATLVGRPGVGGDRTHALWGTHRGEPAPLTAREAKGLLRWSAAYPDAPDDALDPERPPTATLTAPDGRRWPWEDPGLPGALRADLGRELVPRRAAAGQQDLPSSVLVTVEATRLAVERALGRALDLRRFRTNVHLTLDSAPFAEERWEGARMHFAGGVVLRLAHPCVRCVIPTRDPDTQLKWPELARWLVAQRDNLFGLNAWVQSSGRIALGEAVSVEFDGARAG